MPTLTSVKGVVALLTDDDATIRSFALQKLHDSTDVFWYEIAPHLALLEEIHETAETEKTRQIAALTASRVYFHLGEYEDSVQFALGAGDLFNVRERSMYTDCIVGKCIDSYITLKENNGVDNPRLERLFCSLVESWEKADSDFFTVKELIGLMLRARRLDLLKGLLQAYVKATNSGEMLQFTLRVTDLHVYDIKIRREVLLMLSSMFAKDMINVDYFSLVRCYIFLGDAAAVGKVLVDLFQKKEMLVAYQIGFDLFEQCNQEFLQAVTTSFESLLSTLSSAEDYAAPAGKMANVLCGEVTTSLFVKFLYSQSKADVHILNHVKKSIDPKNSTLHNATVMSNALMYSGTTIDGFLRDNLEWLGKANQWAKFTATASVGVIHKGHVDQAMTILKPYLPSGPSSSSPFQEAGALYALGLIHAPIGVQRHKDTVKYLLDSLRTYSSSDQIIHGASLGLGLAAMGLHDEDLFDTLYATVSGCDAVAGEAAALGIGLVMLGSGNTRIVEMLLSSAREEQKEKSIRGLCMAIALIMIGSEGNSDAITSQMLADRDPWIRVGGCFTVGLAYAGSSNAKAVETLLHTAVKDVSDEVRRNAVIQIGFVTYKDTNLCIDMIKLVSDSYNPHIRYGVAMALGIAAAGTAHKAAVDILWTMTQDTTDFVRQGAIIALAMVLMQKSEKECAKVKEFRKLLETKISGKEDTCTKVGCILATGLLDAGGRNCTISLHKQRHGLTKSIVGVFMFLQYWYWFPFTLMVSLALQPMCIIGLNENLNMPKYSFRSNAAPSQFAAPKSVLVAKKETKHEEVKRAVLSTTKKELDFKRKRQATMNPDVDEGMGSRSPTKDADSPAKPDAEKKAADAAVEKKEDEKEPNFEVLSNPSRVTLSQFDYLSHTIDERYVPVKKLPMGVCMLKDNKPDAAVELIDEIDTTVTKDGEKEPDPPEPFEYP